MATSTDWQCDKKLQDCLKHMFDTETAADVTFRVGENKEIVRAHKFILISRSLVFYAMFEGPMSEKGEVTVPDIVKSVFVDFLRYLYTDQTALKSHNAVQIMYAAKKYCVDRLAEECHNVIKKSLTTENACDLLEQAHICAEESLASDCRKIILENPKQCLESHGFTNLCKSCVFNIADQDDLAVVEEIVYKAVMRWSEAECGRQNLEVTDISRRQVLGDVIYTVRFPVMDDNVFNKEVLKHDVLSNEEIVGIARVKQGHLSGESIKFKCNARSSKQIIKISRFAARHKSRHWGHGGSSDAISFIVSHDVMFHGVGMYGNTSSILKVKIILELYESDKRLVKHELCKDTDNDIVDVMLDKSLQLSASVMYTVVVNVSSESGKFFVNDGNKGQQIVESGVVSVSFYNSDMSKNSTSVSGGQIPSLYISLR